MQININELNALPAKTWRWMGVNGENVRIDLPEIAPYQGSPFTQHAPKGVTVYDIIKDEIVFMDDEPDPTLHEGILGLMRKNHNCGFFLHAAPQSKTEDPLIFDYTVDETNPAVLDDNLILAEAGSNLTVIVHVSSPAGAKGLHCGMTKVVAKKGAKVRVISVQTLGDGSRQFDAVGASLGEDAQVEVIKAELGGERIYSAAHARLEGPESRFDQSYLYLGDGERKIDLSVTADQFGKKTVSEIAARGALMGSSEKIFRGTIDFKKGSSGSRGREEENTMLFGPGVRNRTAPLILCAEEDVDGHHAASTGRVDENRMFYLMSRGLTETEARMLLIEAEFAPITAKIPVAAYRQEITETIKKRLSRIESL